MNNSDDCIVEYQLGSQLISDEDKSGSGRDYFRKVADNLVITRTLSYKNTDYIAVLLEKKLVITSNTSQQLIVDLPLEFFDTDCSYREMCWSDVCHHNIPSLFILIDKGSILAPLLYQFEFAAAANDNLNGVLTGPFSPPTRRKPHQVALLFANSLSDLPVINIVYSDFRIESIMANKLSDSNSWISSNPSFLKDWQLECCLFNAPKRVLVAFGPHLPHGHVRVASTSEQLDMRFLVPVISDGTITWKEVEASDSSKCSILHRVRLNGAEETYPIAMLKLPISSNKISLLSQLVSLINELLAFIGKVLSYLSKLVLAEAAPLYSRLVQLSASPDGRFVMALHADDSVSIVEVCRTESDTITARVSSHSQLLSYQLPTTESTAAHAVAVQFLSQDRFVKLSRSGEISLWKLCADDSGTAVAEVISPASSTASSFNRWLQVPPPIGLSTTNSMHYLINEENRVKLFFLRRLGGTGSTFQILSMCTQTALESIHNTIMGSTRPLTVMAVDTATAIAMDAGPSLGDTVHKLLWKRWRSEADQRMSAGSALNETDDRDSFFICDDESILAHSVQLSQRNVSEENFEDSLKQQSHHLTLFQFKPLEIIRQVERDIAFICEEVLQVVRSLVDRSWAREESGGSDISIQLCQDLIEEAIQRIHLCNLSLESDFDVLRESLSTEKEKIKLLQSIVDEEMHLVSLNRSGFEGDVDNMESTLFDNIDVKSLALGNTRAFLNKRLLLDLRKRTSTLDLVAIAHCVAQRALSAGLLIATLEVSPGMCTSTILSVLEECPASMEPSQCIAEVLQWWMVKRRSEIDVAYDGFGEDGDQLQHELDLLSRWLVHRALTLVRCGFPIYAFRLADSVLHIVDAVGNQLDSSSTSHRSEDISNSVLLHRELYYFCQLIGIGRGSFNADFYLWLQQPCEGRVRLLLASCCGEDVPSQVELVSSLFLIFKSLCCNFDRPYLISSLHPAADMLQVLNQFISGEFDSTLDTVLPSTMRFHRQEERRVDNAFDSILVDQLTEYVSLSQFTEKKHRLLILSQVLAVVSMSSPTLPVRQRIIGAPKQLLRLVIGACVAFDDIAEGLDIMWQLLEFTPKSVVFDLRADDPDSKNELSLFSHELDTIQQALTISEIVKNYMPVPPLSIFMVRQRRKAETRELTIEEWFRNCPDFCSRTKSKRLRLYRHQLKTELLKGVRYLMAPFGSTADEDETKALGLSDPDQQVSFTLEQCLMAQMCSSIMKEIPEDDVDATRRLNTLATDLQTICNLHFSTEGSLSAEVKFEVTQQQSKWAAQLFLRCLLDSEYYSDNENIYMPIIEKFCRIGSSTNEEMESLCDTLSSMKLSWSLVVPLILHHCKELINSLSSCCVTALSDADGDDGYAYSKFARARKLLACIETGKLDSPDGLAMKGNIVSEKTFLEIISFLQSLELELAPIQVRLMQPSKAFALILQERPQAYYSIVNWTASPNLNVRDGDECLYGSVLAYRDSLKARSCPGQEFLKHLKTALNKTDSMFDLVRQLLGAAMEFQDSENAYCLCLEFIKLNAVAGTESDYLTESSESDEAVRVVLNSIDHLKTIARAREYSSITDGNPADTKVRFAIDEPSTLSFLADDLRTEFLASCSVQQLSRLIQNSQKCDQQEENYIRTLMHGLLLALERPDFQSATGILQSISVQSKYEEAVTHSLISDKNESLSFVKGLVTELEKQLIQWRLSPAGQQFDQFRHNSTTDLPPPDADMINKIISKGFSKNGAKRAVYYSRSVSVENALSWAVEHCNDQDFDFPLALTVRGALMPQPSGDAPSGLLVSGECLPTAITYLQEQFIKVLSPEPEKSQPASVIQEEQAELVTIETVPLTESVFIDTSRRDKKGFSKRTSSSSPKRPLPTKAKTATRLQTDINDAKDFIDFDFSSVRDDIGAFGGEIKSSGEAETNTTNIPVSLNESHEEIVSDQQPVGHDVPVAETSLIDQSEDPNIFIEDIYPDIITDLTANDVPVADFQSPLRSQSLEPTTASESLQVLEPIDLPNTALLTSLHDLQSAIENVLTDKVYLSLISEDVYAQLNLSEENFGVNKVLKEDYLMALNSRCDDSLSDIMGLSLELAKDVLSFSTPSTEVSAIESLPMKRILIEIVLLAAFQDDLDASIKLVECISTSAPTFLKTFEDYSAPILQHLLHFTHLDEVVSVKASLDWYLRILCLQEQVKADNSAVNKDNLKNLLEKNIKILKDFPHLSLIVLDSMYCVVDGRKIIVVELLKKIAVEVLRSLNESHHNEANQEFLSLTDLLMHCHRISSQRQSQYEWSDPQRQAVLDKALASLEEDVASLKRISRVPDHERGDSRKIIKSAHLLSGCFALRLLRQHQGEGIVEAATAAADGDRARVVAIAELIFPSGVSNHLPLLRPSNVQDWIRAAGRILSVGPSELHFLCLWGYIFRLQAMEDTSTDESHVLEWYRELSQATDVAVAKLRTNHLLILALVSLGVPLYRVDLLLNCPVTSLLLDISNICISYIQKPLTDQACSSRKVAQKVIHRLQEAQQVHVAGRKEEGSLSIEAGNICTFLKSLEAFNSSITVSEELVHTIKPESSNQNRNLENVFVHILTQSFGTNDKKEFRRVCVDFYIPTILDSGLSVEAIVELLKALLLHHPVISDCIHDISGGKILCDPESFLADEDSMEMVASALWINCRSQLPRIDADFASEGGRVDRLFRLYSDLAGESIERVFKLSKALLPSGVLGAMIFDRIIKQISLDIQSSVVVNSPGLPIDGDSIIRLTISKDEGIEFFDLIKEFASFSTYANNSMDSWDTDSCEVWVPHGHALYLLLEMKVTIQAGIHRTKCSHDGNDSSRIDDGLLVEVLRRYLVCIMGMYVPKISNIEEYPINWNEITNIESITFPINEILKSGDESSRPGSSSSSSSSSPQFQMVCVSLFNLYRLLRWKDSHSSISLQEYHQLKLQSVHTSNRSDESDASRSCFAAILALTKLLVRANAWIPLELVAVAELSNLGPRQEEHTKEFIDNIRLELVHSPAYVRDEVDILLGGSYTTEAMQRISSRLSDCDAVLTDEDLQRSMASFLLALTSSIVGQATPPLPQFAQSPAWRYLGAALRAVQRVAFSDADNNSNSDSERQCFPLIHIFYSALRDADEAGASSFHRSRRSLLRWVRRLPPAVICASLLAQGMVLEAALLFWQSSDALSLHAVEFDLHLSLDRLLRELVALRDGDSGGKAFDADDGNNDNDGGGNSYHSSYSTVVRESIAVLVEWLGAS